MTWDADRVDPGFCGIVSFRLLAGRLALMCELLSVVDIILYVIHFVIYSQCEELSHLNNIEMCQNFGDLIRTTDIFSHSARFCKDRVGKRPESFVQ